MGSSSAFITAAAQCGLLLLSVRAWGRIPSESRLVRLAVVMLLASCTLSLLLSAIFRNASYLSLGSVGIVVASAFFILAAITAEKMPQGL